MQQQSNKATRLVEQTPCIAVTNSISMTRYNHHQQTTLQIKEITEKIK